MLNKNEFEIQNKIKKIADIERMNGEKVRAIRKFISKGKSGYGVTRKK